MLVPFGCLVLIVCTIIGACLDCAYRSSRRLYGVIRRPTKSMSVDGEQLPLLANDTCRLSTSVRTASLSADDVAADMDDQPPLPTTLTATPRQARPERQNGAARKQGDDDRQREDKPTNTETVVAPCIESPADHIAVVINDERPLPTTLTTTHPRPTSERQGEAAPKQDSGGDKGLHIVTPIITIPDPEPNPSPIEQLFNKIWHEYDESARSTKAIAAQPANAAGLASGLFQLRTGLAIFDTLIDVSIQPALFSRNSMATVDAYVPACPHDAAPLIGTATTQALNSCDAVDKAARDVNSWCMQAESFLGFAIEAVRDDNLTDATTVAVELCRSGVEVMQRVATAMHSCIDTLKHTAVMYKELAALHKTSAKIDALTNGELGSICQFEPENVEWANVLKRHVQRIGHLVRRIEGALKELEKTRVIEALEGYLAQSVLLQTLNRATLSELTMVSSALLKECKTYQHKHQERIALDAKYNVM